MKFYTLDIIPDGLTTCDLCSWASQDKQTKFFNLESHQGKFKKFYAKINQLN